MSDRPEAKVTRDALHVGERKRLEKVESAFRVHAAALHADALSEIMVNALVDGLVNDPAVFHHLVTGGTEEVDPSDHAKMRALTRNIIQSDDLAVRNLEFSSASRKTELEAEYLTSLKPGEALNQQRAGILEQRKAAYVAEKFDARLA